MTPLLLYLLATTDTAFAGFRAAAGRNGRIYKRRYYTRAVLRGLCAGQALIAAAGLVILAVILAQSDRTRAFWELASAGQTMVWVYGIYATVVLLAFLPYLFWGSEIRTLTTVIVFGPLTLLRPGVVLAGVLACVARKPTWAVAISAAAASTAVLLLEPLLDRWYTRQTQQKSTR